MITSDQLRLSHAYNAANTVLEAVRTRGIKVFLDDPILMAGIERHLEIVGEAINHLSGTFKDAHPEIGWKKIVRFRNFLVHEYFAIDVAIVLNVIDEKLPALVAAIKPLLKEEE